MFFYWIGPQQASEREEVEDSSRRDVKPEVIIIAHDGQNDSEKLMSVDAQGFQEVQTRRKRRLSSRNDPEMPSLGEDVCELSEESSSASENEEGSRSNSVKNLTLEGAESQLTPSLSWAEVASKVTEHKEEKEIGGDTHIQDNREAIQ